MSKKQRLDQALVERSLCDSREMAKRLILAGEVSVGGHPAAKPSHKVEEADEIVLKQRPKFVGRGGLKLEGALEHFDFDVTDLVGLDIGASTGGFTDCMLQRGARKVFAFDVGTNQLVWKLRSDPRVVVREKFNCRYLKPEDIGEEVDLVVTDVSFISLTKILRPAFDVLKENGSVICLIKPQFELEQHEVGKGGIVREPELHDKAVEKIRQYVEGELKQRWCALTDSPITGTDGNKEFLAWLKKS